MSNDYDGGRSGSGWKEDITVAGKEVVQRIKQLIKEGNVRRLIIKKANGEVIKELSLNQGVAIGAVLTMLAPVLAVIGAGAALLTQVKIEVIRDQPPEDEL